MLKQLPLWPMKKVPSQTLDFWQDLDHEQQNQVITAVARLIRKIVCPEKANQIKGANNEQQ